MSPTETAAQDPHAKDYDAAEDTEPTRWPGRFDISHWGLVCARQRTSRCSQAGRRGRRSLGDAPAWGAV
jgi:hypothetical protein